MPLALFELGIDGNFDTAKQFNEEAHSPIEEEKIERRTEVQEKKHREDIFSSLEMHTEDVHDNSDKPETLSNQELRRQENTPLLASRFKGS